MPTLTDGGMNNMGAVDGLRLPQLVSMLSLMSLDYASGTPNLKPNQSLFNLLQEHSDSFDFGDGNGVRKGITMFDLDEAIKRALVGAFFSGHQISADLGSTPAGWVSPRFEGDLILIRAGAPLTGTPSISTKDAVYAWSEKATRGIPDAITNKTGFWVDATPALVAVGLLNSAKSVVVDAPAPEACKDIIEGGVTKPEVHDANYVLDTYNTGIWYRATDGLIRKAKIDTYIAPTAFMNINYTNAWGETNVHYTQEEFDNMSAGVYCTFFAALRYLADLGGVPRGEFGHYAPDTFLSGIVTALGDIRSDASIETFTNLDGQAVPAILSEASANDDYISGQYYQSNFDGKVYQRIGPTGGVDPSAFKHPNYSGLWSSGITVEAFKERFKVVNKLRIHIQHDGSVSGNGSEASPMALALKHDSSLTGLGSVASPVALAIQHDTSLAGLGSQAIPLSLTLQHDASLTGDGSQAAPVRVTLQHDTSLAGEGSKASPLSLTIRHDTSLAGDGSAASPMYLTLQHDASLTGEGSAASPMRVQTDQINFSTVPRC